MNSIVFFLENKPTRLTAFDFFLWMLSKGVAVSFAPLPVPSEPNISKDTLVITDNRASFECLYKKDILPLVLLYEPDQADMYPEAKYFVMDVWKTEFSYFEKVFQRIHNQPWTIAKTLRLTLRETVESDVDIFEQIYSDKEITRYTEGLYDTETEKKYITEYREKVYACQNFGIWTVIENLTGKIIGRAGLSVREGIEGVEIGFLIGKAFQNRGYATEAINSILKFASKEKLFPVYALVVKENAPSFRVLSKSGFEEAGSVNQNGVEYQKLILTEDNYRPFLRMR